MQPVRGNKFDWREYTSFGFNFILPILIGLGVGIVNRHKTTVNEYLFGGKKMTIFPITMSMISSYLSCGILLSVPADIHYYGVGYMMISVITLLISLVGVFVFLPFLYSLQLVNVYEYFEKRFCKTVRTIATVLFIIRQLTAVPGSLFGISIALNQYTNINLHVIRCAISIVCTFYTTIGGFVAIVWADTIQAIIMIATVITIVTFGVNEQGFFNIIETATIGKRTTIFNMDPDPTIRISFWTSTIGFFIHYCGISVVYPSFIQRYISLPKENYAKWALFFFGLVTSMMLLFACFMGLITYAKYEGCDPYEAKLIAKPDQIVPYYVRDAAHDMPGFAGFYLAGIACASLSTMSTCLNTAAGIIFEDTNGIFFQSRISEFRSNVYLKCLVVTLGFVCLGLTYISETLGTLIVMISLFDGLTGGITLGLFILGGFIPSTNASGAICGGFAGIFVSIWLIIGYVLYVSHGLIHYNMPPTSTSNCTFNMTISNGTIRSNLSENSIVHYLFPLSKVSIFYYSTICFLTTVVLGMITSYLSRNRSENVNPELLFPIVRKYYCKKIKTYAIVRQKEEIEKSSQHTFSVD